MPIAQEHAFREKPTKSLILYPSEPFTIAHFNVRHPVCEPQSIWCKLLVLSWLYTTSVIKLSFYSIFRLCPHRRPIEYCVTCPRTDTRQNPRQTENQIHHYEPSYQRNQYESTYERPSSTFQTSRNEELYRNLQERREREQFWLKMLLFFLFCICAFFYFLNWASTQGYNQYRNKRW